MPGFKGVMMNVVNGDDAVAALTTGYAKIGCESNHGKPSSDESANAARARSKPPADRKHR